MNSESGSGFTAQYIREEHLCAINDLTRSYDSFDASFHVLRRISALIGAFGAFFGVTKGEEIGQRENSAIIAASTGNFFPDIEIVDDLVLLAGSYGWTERQERFQKTLEKNPLQPELFLVGYPLFNDLGTHIGLLMVVVPSEESIRILEELGPLLIFLLIHRIQEFTFLESIKNNSDKRAREIIGARGLYFPSVADLIGKTTHDLNGHLALLGLQTDILQNQTKSIESNTHGFERLKQAIKRSGHLLEMQEQAVSLLLDISATSYFVDSCNLSLRTFCNGLNKQIEIDFIPNQTADFKIPFRGNVGHWFFHNIFRASATLYQGSLDFEIEPIRVELTPQIHRKSKSFEMLIRLPSNELLGDFVVEILGPVPLALGQKKLPGLIQVINKLFVICGGNLTLTQNSDSVDIVMSFSIEFSNYE